MYIYLLYLDIYLTSLALIARETAPAAAYKDMFHGNSDLSHYGPLASGIPGIIQIIIKNIFF